ncbi:type III secretion component [Pseudomonas syringae pv. actinidiae str. M302091]|uniref:type III secretion system cytoplasmic ring protein SctQ n=1 Tax=Pseudomonas syringae TaxID=317 RepID=UPI0002092918|nr:type III secretion system cytoplasmic ring protein SctQ [Pseudomonas syringae]EGH63967.1 type III secretion component [Pseudomonas syringae pv. actinidiae str. M302091]
MTAFAQPVPASVSGDGIARSRLAQFDAGLLNLHNRLHRQTAPWRIVLGQRPFGVRWTSQGGECQQPVRGAVRLGQREMALDVPLELFEQSGLAWQPGPAIATPAEALLLEHAWLSWIEPLETLTGESFQVLPRAANRPAELPGNGISVAMEIQPDDGPAHTLSLHLQADSARQVIALLERHAAVKHDPLVAVRLQMSVEAGQAPLNTSELRSLVPGDVVMLDTLPDAQVQLRLGSHCQTVARRQGETLEWLGPLRSVTRHHAAHTFNRNDLMSEITASPDLDTSLDDLPLTLVCQLGTVELTLAQLREMAPGSLLPLATPAHDEVDLMVNGRRIGRGQLVSIGDGLGVRLLGFNGS